MRPPSRFFYVRDGEPVKTAPSRPLPATPDQRVNSKRTSTREPPMSAPLTSQPFFGRSPSGHENLLSLASNSHSHVTPEGSNGGKAPQAKRIRYNSGAVYSDWLWKAGPASPYQPTENAGGKGILGYTGRRPLQGNQLHPLKLPSRYHSLSPHHSKLKVEDTGGMSQGFSLSQRALLSPAAVNGSFRLESQASKQQRSSYNALGLSLGSEDTKEVGESSSSSDDTSSKDKLEEFRNKLQLKSLNLPLIPTRLRSDSRSAPPTPTGTRDNYFPFSPEMASMDEALPAPPAVFSQMEGSVSPSPSNEVCVHPPEMVCFAGCCARRPQGLNSPSMSFRRIVSDSDGQDPTEVVQASEDALVHSNGAGGAPTKSTSLKKKLSKPSLRRLTDSMKRSKSSPALRKLAAATELAVPNTIESQDESFHCLEAGIGDEAPKKKLAPINVDEDNFTPKAKPIELDALSSKSKNSSAALKRIRSLVRVAGFRRSFKGGAPVGAEEEEVPALTEAMRVVAAEKERELHTQAQIQTQSQPQVDSRAPVLSMSILDSGGLFGQSTNASIPLTSTPPVSSSESQEPMMLLSALTPSLVVSGSNSTLDVGSEAPTRSSTTSDPFRFSQFESVSNHEGGPQEVFSPLEFQNSSQDSAEMITFGSDGHHPVAHSNESSDSDYSNGSAFSNFENFTRSSGDATERSTHKVEGETWEKRPFETLA